jgi:hypothetical protein
MQKKGWPKEIELLLDVITFPDDATNEPALINKIAEGFWAEEAVE